MSSDDAMTASKAFERRARLSHMMGGGGGEGGGHPHDDFELSSHEQTATNNKTKNNKATTTDEKTKKKNVSHSCKMTTPYVPPSALSDLECKIAAAAAAAAGGAKTNKNAYSSSTTKNAPQYMIGLPPVVIPGSVTQVHSTMTAATARGANAGHRKALWTIPEGELIAKASSSSIPPHRRTTSGRDRAAADTAEKAASMGHMLHQMIMTGSGNYSHGHTGGPKSILSYQEANALRKQQLPRRREGDNDNNDIPQARPSKGGNDEDGTDTSSSSYYHMDSIGVYHATTDDDNHNNTKALTAVIVDEAVERDKIAKEAHDLLLASSVIATKVDDDEADRRRAFRRFAIVIVTVMLLVLAVLLGGVCGTGNCSRGPSAAARAQALVKFLSTVSSSLRPNENESAANATAQKGLVYPFVGDAGARSPEQEALDHLINDDPLKLSVVANGNVAANWRLVQRYALLVLWFTNGPFTPGDTISKVQDSRSAASAGWLVGSHECGWSGVDCDNGRVVQLNLGGRNLTGTVPPNLALLTDLVELRLKSNQLKGSLEDITSILIGGGAMGLVTLDLSFNAQLAGTIPDRLATSFKALQELNLDVTAITGTIPESLATMTGLELLRMSWITGLTGTIPTSLAALTKLTALGLGHNDLSRVTNFDFLTGMTDLTYLNLAEPRNRGGEQQQQQLASLSQLAGLSKLTQLELLDVPVLDTTIPSAVVDWWPNMWAISLAQCNLTGTIPLSLARWDKMSSMDLSFNQLTGTIPLAVYAAWSDQLKVFNVAFNDLVGTLPAELGLWSHLNFLDLRNNALTGTLPTTIGLLNNATVLTFSGNMLVGTIPTEVLNLPSGATVFYDNTDLTGTAPYCPNGTLPLVTHQVDCDKVSCPCCSKCK